jgi:hypothetical protein
VVTRTRDGGKTWETFAFGSTTGGIWTSADQGDRWTLLSAHLPPIAAVTWAP